MPMLALAAALVCLAAALVSLTAAAPARAWVIGFGLQRAGGFTNPRFERLGVRYARYVTPWDVMGHADDRAQLDAWLSQARLDSVRPMVAFRAVQPAPGGSHP
jgi:hypothetical protein